MVNMCQNINTKVKDIIVFSSATRNSSHFKQVLLDKYEIESNYAFQAIYAETCCT